jgi:two-component system, response regulator / RNA-binding antiterminator
MHVVHAVVQDLLCKCMRKEASTLKVLLIDDTPDRASSVRSALLANGFDVVSLLDSSFDLPERVADEVPDVIIIHTDSPSRDVLEHIAIMNQNAPRPVVMFSDDSANASIRAAIRAGVTAYIVDGLSEARLAPILTVAVERFEAEQELKHELAESRSQLAERKLIERAKGLMMKHARMDEEMAFEQLRKLAMDRGEKLAATAKFVIARSKA